MSIPARPVHTPWGQANSETVYAEGVVFYGTPSHGGFWLDPERNAKVHPLLREPDRWFEEDCAWAKVAYTFPELFSENDRDAAVRTLKTWYPDAWEAITGEVLQPGESYVKEVNWYLDHRVFRSYRRCSAKEFG